MIARANVLGVGINALNMTEAVDLCSNLVARKTPGYVCVTGVHGIMEAQRDPSLRRVLNSSFLTVPDGMPTVWIGRLQGYSQMRRVYGPDFMLALCSESVGRGLRHFLYGGKEGVASELACSLALRFPGINIVGTFTPPFRTLTDVEQNDLVNMIAVAKPDIVWVGLSTPKQERFMASYLSRLDTFLMVGVGAAFDIHTGRINDAPAWMKSAGLQWLHRLAQEPRRLWKRYLINNPLFVVYMILQLAGRRGYNLEP